MRYLCIRDIWVEEKVLTTYFSCDYEKCQGACCWGSIEGVELNGGLLLQKEAQYIRENRSEVTEFSDIENAPEILTKPVYQEGKRYFTSLSKKAKGCLFSNTTCKTCAFKIMKDEGKDIDIPVHCAMYPLFVVPAFDGRDCITFTDTFEEEYCKSSFQKGKEENTLVFQFVKPAIIRLYGEDFYNALQEYVEEANNLKHF